MDSEKTRTKNIHSARSCNSLKFGPRLDFREHCFVKNGFYWIPIEIEMLLLLSKLFKHFLLQWESNGNHF